MSLSFTITDNVGYGVDFKCVAKWSGFPSGEQIDMLSKLLRDWFNIGMQGVYDGNIHYLGNIETTGTESVWFVDMGTADADKALCALAKLIDNFNENAPVGFSNWKKIESLICGD